MLKLDISKKTPRLLAMHAMKQGTKLKMQESKLPKKPTEQKPVNKECRG
jgi:hypothetical protein